MAEPSDPASDPAITEKEDDSDEVKELKRRLAKAEGRSNQPTPAKDTPTEIVGLSKEQSAAVLRGRAMAAFVNGTR